MKICGKRDASLLSLMEQCEMLNTAYIDTRYPVHWPTNYSKEKAQKMQDAAGKIAQTVKEILEKGRRKVLNQLFAPSPPVPSAPNSAEARKCKSPYGKRAAEHFKRLAKNS